MFGKKRAREGKSPIGSRTELATWLDFCKQQGLLKVAVDGEDGGRGDQGEQVPLERSGNAGTEKRQVEQAIWWRVVTQGEGEEKWTLLRLRHHVAPSSPEHASGHIVIDKIARRGESAQDKDEGVAAAIAASKRIPSDLHTLRSIRREGARSRTTAGGGTTGGQHPDTPQTSHAPVLHTGGAWSRR